MSGGPVARKKKAASLVGQVRVEIDYGAGGREENSKWVTFFAQHDFVQNFLEGNCFALRLLEIGRANQ